jgi:hypothetical protein
MTTYTVTLEIPATICMTVEADDPQDAIEKAEGYAALHGIDKYDIQWDEASHGTAIIEED